EEGVEYDIQRAGNLKSMVVGGDSLFVATLQGHGKEGAKQAKGMTDNAKIAIRNIRKHSNDQVKNLYKDKEITEDENKRAQEEVQKITDGFVKSADDTLRAKEQEILTV
ncbi:ribosome recycling factor, partial [Arcobacter sp. HD9-500m-PIT-SAG03]